MDGVRRRECIPALRWGRCKGDRKGRPYAGVRLSESAERILRRAEGSPPYGGCVIGTDDPSPTGGAVERDVEGAVPYGGCSNHPSVACGDSSPERGAASPAPCGGTLPTGEGIGGRGKREIPWVGLKKRA